MSRIDIRNFFLLINFFILCFVGIFFLEKYKKFFLFFRLRVGNLLGLFLRKLEEIFQRERRVVVIGQIKLHSENIRSFWGAIFSENIKKILGTISLFQGWGWKVRKEPAYIAT